MSTRIICLLAGAALVGLTPVAMAQPPAAAPAATTPAAGLPSGDSLFAKHVEAVGGLEALRSQKSARIKGRMTRPGGTTALITVWRKAPDKMYKIMEIPGQVTVETWCDGESAWMRNSNKGSARITGEDLRNTKLEAEFIGEANYKARYKELVTREKTTFNGRPAYAVAATTIVDKPRTLYFDAEKGFLLGVQVPTSSARGQAVLTISFSEYKKFGSTWQPTVLVEDNGHVKATTEFNEIEMDIAMMPSLEPPDEVKNLK